MTTHDFEALKNKRNKSIQQVIWEMAKKLGAKSPEKIRHNFDYNACYCTCGEKGEQICEHRFSIDKQDDHASFAECEICGMSNISHDSRFF